MGCGGDGGDLGIKLSEFGGNVWASWWFCSIEFSNVRLLKVAVAFRVVPISFEVAKAVSDLLMQVKGKARKAGWRGFERMTSRASNEILSRRRVRISSSFPRCLSRRRL